MVKKNNKKPHYWLNAVRHLQLNDPVISKLINKHSSKTYLVCSNTVFITLMKIIIGQQISIEVANSIENKIKKLLGSINSKKILAIPDQQLRNCGLSYRKVKYIKGVAEIIQSKSRFFSKLETMDDEYAIKELMKLYGIGLWSAEMFLIFHFNRQNILPLGDIGLINSYCKNYKTNRSDFIKKISQTRKLWDPYCTVATWYLWRDIDEDVVQY
tara:strand:- start:3741 stop:4379 length:639 start_codon:yes stop_codon:yes gene_type:complete